MSLFHNCRPNGWTYSNTTLPVQSMNLDFLSDVGEAQLPRRMALHFKV